MMAHSPVLVPVSSSVGYERKTVFVRQAVLDLALASVEIFG